MNRTRIGANVKSRRKELRLTQADLAEMAHVSVIHISHIETGAVNMSLETLLAICYALGVTPNDILVGEYLTHSVDDMLFREPSNKLNYDDKLLLQSVFRYMEERNSRK